MRKIILSLIFFSFTNISTAQEPCDCVDYITYFGSSVSLGTSSGERIQFYTIYKPEQKLCIKNTYNEKGWNERLRKDFIRAIKNHKAFKNNTFSGNNAIIENKDELLENKVPTQGLRDKFKIDNYFNKQIEIKLDYTNVLSEYQLCSNVNSLKTKKENTYEKNQRKIEEKRKLEKASSDDFNDIVKRREKESIQNKEYADGLTNSFSESFDSEGNFNTGAFINTLPKATTKTQAYSNLALSGISILSGIFSEINNTSSYENEIRKRREQFKNGIGEYDYENKKTGQWTYFYMGTTSPKSSGSYKNGKKHGIWEFYDDQEYSSVMYKKMKQVIVYNNGVVLQKYKAKNSDYNITKEVGLLSNKKTFISERGNYIIKDNKKIKYGLWEKYNDFGVNTSTGYYNINGLRTGFWSFGYKHQKNGVWYSRKYSLSSTANYSNGLITGKKTVFSRNGNILAENFYENGQLIRFKQFDKNGILIKTTKIKLAKGEVNINTNEQLTNLLNNPKSQNPLELNIKEGVITNSSLKIISNNFSKLKKLSIYNSNKIDDIPIEFSKLKELESLTLRVGLLKYVPNLIIELPKLNILDLKYNLISKLPKNFGKFKNLKTLNLSSNEISIISESIGDLNSLNTLFLHYNKLSHLPKNFGELVNLKTLYLDNNKLSSLPKNFENLVNLKTLFLNNNFFIRLPVSLEKLINLEKLTIHNNGMTSLNFNFEKLTKLNVLYIGSTMHPRKNFNRLTHLPESIGTLKNLMVLHLFGTGINKLPKNIGNLVNLLELDLRGCTITNLPDSFENLINLKRIFLDKSHKKILKRDIKRIKRKNKNLEIKYY